MPGSRAIVLTTATALVSRRLQPETAVSRRSCALAGSIGEQHATPGQAIAPATARASRRLRLEADVSRRGCVLPGSIGEQHARPGH